MESKFVDTGSQKMHYLAGGRGKAVILIPSFGISSRTYHQLGVLLSEFYRVIIPDIYKGKSEFNKNPISISEYSEELNKFINLSEIKELYLIGFSAGGLVVTDYLVKHHDIVAKAMLFSTSAVFINIRYKLLRFISGYGKLTLHYLRSVSRLKFEMLCLSDAFSSYIRHPFLFFRELKSVVSYNPDKITEFKIPVKLVFALQDEFLEKSVFEENKSINNLETETVNEDHAWFFIKKDIFVKKVRGYFG